MPEYYHHRKVAMIVVNICCVQMARIPVVAITANAMEYDRVKCIDAGMDDYCTKVCVASNV